MTVTKRGDLLQDLEFHKPLVQSCDESAKAWESRLILQRVLERLILDDVDYAVAKRLEQELWHLCFKSFIDKLNARLKSTTNAKPSEHDLAMLNVLLSAAHDSLSRTLTELSIQYGYKGVKIMSQTSLGILSQQFAKPKKASSGNLEYLSQFFLVHLGDISRYQKQLRLAESYYLHATKLAFSNGHAFNQLGILEASRGSRLSAVYFYYRSLSVGTPFVLAETNLDQLYKSLTKHILDGIVENDSSQKSPAPRDVKSAVGGLGKLGGPGDDMSVTKGNYVHQYLVCLALIHQCAGLDKASRLVDGLTSGRILVDVAETGGGVQSYGLTHMMVINMAAIGRLYATYLSKEDMASRLGCIDQIVNQLSDDERTCLNLLHGLFLGQISDILFYATSLSDSAAVASISAVIRLALVWITSHPWFLEYARWGGPRPDGTLDGSGNCTAEGSIPGGTHSPANFCQFLNNLVRFLNLMQEPTEIRRPKGFRDNFALPEEIELRGFQPLQTIGFANLDFSVNLNNFDEMQIQKARLLRLFSASKAIVDAIGNPAILVCEHPATDSGKLFFRCGNIAMLDKNRGGSSAGKLEDGLINKSRLDELRRFSSDGSNGGDNGELGILGDASPTLDSGRSGRGNIGFDLGDEGSRERTGSPASAGGSPLDSQSGLTAGKSSSKINVALKSIISNNAKAGMKPYSSTELMKETEAGGTKQVEGANLVSPAGVVENDSKSTPSSCSSLRTIPGAIKIAAPGMAVELPIKTERKRKEASAIGENVDDDDDDDDDEDDDRELGGNYKLEENLQRIISGKMVSHSGQSDPLRASGNAGISGVNLGSKGRPSDTAEDADGAGGPNDPAGSNRPRYELPPRFQAAKLKMALGGAQFRKAEMPQGIDVTAKEGDIPSPPPFVHPYHDPSMEYGVKQQDQIQIARRGQRGNVVTGQLRGNGAFGHPQSSSFAAFPPLSYASSKGHHLQHQQRDFEGVSQRGDHGGVFLPPRLAKGVDVHNSAEGIRGYAPSVAGLLANFKEGSDSESGIRHRSPDDMPGGARHFHTSQSGNTFPGSDGHRQSLSIGGPNFGPTEGGHQQESMSSDLAGMSGGADDFPKTPGVRPPFGPPIYGPGGPFMFPGTANFPNHGGPPQVGGLATMYNVGHPRPPTFLPPPDFMMPGGFNNSPGVARGIESGGNNVLTRPPMFDSLHRHPFYGGQHQHQPPFSQLPQMLPNPQLPFSAPRPQPNPRPMTGGDDVGFPPLLSAKRGDKDDHRMNNNNWDEEKTSIDGRRDSISRSVEGGSGGEEYPHGKKTVGQRLLHDSGGSGNCESTLVDTDVPQRSLAYQLNPASSVTQFPDKDGRAGGEAKSSHEDGARDLMAKANPAQGKPGGGVPATVANLPQGMLPEFLVNRHHHQQQQQQQFPPNLFLNTAGSNGTGQMFAPPDFPMMDRMTQHILQPGMGRQPDQIFDTTRGFGQMNQGVLDLNQSLGVGDERAGQSNNKQSLAQLQQHQHQQFARDQQRSYQQHQLSTRDPQTYSESDVDRSSRHNPMLGAGVPRHSLAGKNPTDVSVSNPLNFNEPAISCFPSYFFPPPNMSVTGSMPSGNVGQQHLTSTALNQQKPSFPPPSFNSINNPHQSQTLQYFQQASLQQQQQQQQPMFNIGGLDPLFGSSTVGVGGNHHYLMSGGSGGSNIGLPPPASLGGQAMITGDPGVDRLETGLAKLAGQAQAQPRKMMSNESEQQMLASAVSSGAPQFMTHTQNRNILTTGGGLKGSGGGGGSMFPSNGEQGSQGSSLVSTASADQYGNLIRNASQGDVPGNNSLGPSAASRITNSGETANEGNLAGASGVMNLNSGGGGSQHSTFGSPPSSGTETGGIAFTSPAGYSLFDSPWSVFSPVPEQLNRGIHSEAGGGVGRMASQASVSGSVAGQNVGMSSVGLDALGGPNPAGSLRDGSVGASNVRLQQAGGAGGGMGFMLSPGVAQGHGDAVDRGSVGKPGVGPTTDLAGGRSRMSGGSPSASSEYPRWSNNDDIQDK